MKKQEQEQEQVTVVLRPVCFTYYWRTEVRYAVLAKQGQQVTALFPYTFPSQDAARKATLRLAA